jgi:hypothetical protein
MVMVTKTTMSHFDTFLLYFGTIYSCYFIYVNTPFKKDIDNYVKNNIEKYPIAKNTVFYLKLFFEMARTHFSMLSEMNHFLLIDYGYDSPIEETPKEKEKEKEKEKPEEVKFENKYLKKFKVFSNNYVFSEEDLKERDEKCEMLRVNSENERRHHMENVMRRLEEIKQIVEKIVTCSGGIASKEGMQILLEHYGEFDGDDLQETGNELFEELKDTQSTCEKELDELKNMDISLEHFQEEADADMLSKKLGHLMNDYIIEHTPLGNVFMRYNREKGSFEYYSNSTIPYRYLEPIGRRYVMTYHCKPLFVDLEEELKKSEEKLEKLKQQQGKNSSAETTVTNNNHSAVFAKFRKYNKDASSTTAVANANASKYSKNRSSESGTLPPHMRVNLPNVNASSEKQILKENANRYTYEGRLSNFSILKKIDRKVVDKKYAMTFADFKKLQSKE